jgi:hypothetical protein
MSAIKKRKMFFVVNERKHRKAFGDAGWQLFLKIYIKALKVSKDSRYLWCHIIVREFAHIQYFNGSCKSCIFTSLSHWFIYWIWRRRLTFSPQNNLASPTGHRQFGGQSPNNNPLPPLIDKLWGWQDHGGYLCSVGNHACPQLQCLQTALFTRLEKFLF